MIMTRLFNITLLSNQSIFPQLAQTIMRLFAMESSVCLAVVLPEAVFVHEVRCVLDNPVDDGMLNREVRAKVCLEGGEMGPDEVFEHTH